MLQFIYFKAKIYELFYENFTLKHGRDSLTFRGNPYISFKFVISNMIRSIKPLCITNMNLFLIFITKIFTVDTKLVNYRRFLVVILVVMVIKTFV